MYRSKWRCRSHHIRRYIPRNHNRIPDCPDRWYRPDPTDYIYSGPADKPWLLLRLRYRGSCRLPWSSCRWRSPVRWSSPRCCRHASGSVLPDLRPWKHCTGWTSDRLTNRSHRDRQYRSGLLSHRRFSPRIPDRYNHCRPPASVRLRSWPYICWLQSHGSRCWHRWSESPWLPHPRSWIIHRSAGFCGHAAHWPLFQPVQWCWSVYSGRRSHRQGNWSDPPSV